MKKWEANPSNLESVLEELKKSNHTNKINLILFLANDDPATNRSWCPDCVRAEPVIYKTILDKEEESSELKEINVIRAYAGDRTTWRNPMHPWRVDPRFKLRGVPTLVRWEGDCVKGRLEDHQAHLPHLISPLLTASSSSSSST
ncbi:unnamed protein product [Cochlearia groenlandica]